MNNLKVLFIAAEAFPLVKIGGLGDVVGALPSALRALGHDVRVAIPNYRTINTTGMSVETSISFGMHWDGKETLVSVVLANVAGIPFYLIGGAPISDSERVYGTSIDEDGPKFIFFSLAALAAMRQLPWKPDVVHAHDWHAAAAVYWLAKIGQQDEFFCDATVTYTIHNLPFQGNHAGRYLAMAGLLPSPDPRIPWWARDGLMALGIAHADIISAASPGYAREILTPEFGAGLDGLLRACSDQLTGILNGVDYAVWDPKNDRDLAANYDAESLSQRDRNKMALQQECGLAVRPEALLIGVVSRLDYQKGFDLTLPAIQQILQERDIQFVLLGTGNPEIKAQLEAVGRDFLGRASVNLQFDALSASHIYAGSDVFLMPSRYEPCGLGQMIALRYGAVPVVRATGGLADTVQDYADGQGTGFVFAGYSVEALLTALRRALAIFPDKRSWRDLQRRGMKQDFSWARSAQAYQLLYEQAKVFHRKA